MTIIRLTEPKLSTLPPANWVKLAAAFGMEWGPGIVITYGDTIYSPDHPLPGDLLAHETIHVQQQMGYKDGVEAFVQRYIDDEVFRYEIELEAYQVQWRYLRPERMQRIEKQRELKRLVDKMILDLSSGEIYDNKYSADKVRADILSI